MTTTLSQVRREIGDVVFLANGTLLLSDQEIAYAGIAEGSLFLQAARCCEWLEAQFSQKADITEGKLGLKLSQRSMAYGKKARLLRALDGQYAALPYIGGESSADKQQNNDDTDRVPPGMWRGMMDSPLAEPFTPGSEEDDSGFSGDPFLFDSVVTS